MYIILLLNNKNIFKVVKFYQKIIFIQHTKKNLVISLELKKFMSIIQLKS